MFCYDAKLERVIDGDSIVFVLDLGFRLSFKDNFRLKGINAPEMKTEEGPIAKQALQKMLASATNITVFSEKHGKYRWLADVFLTLPDKEEQLHINEWLIENGYAERYL